MRLVNGYAYFGVNKEKTQEAASLDQRGRTGLEATAERM